MIVNPAPAPPRNAPSQLGLGDRESRHEIENIHCLRGRKIYKLFAGFDSDVVYALSIDEKVYVWGSGTTMLGVMKWDRERLECKPDFEIEFDSDDEDDNAQFELQQLQNGDHGQDSEGGGEDVDSEADSSEYSDSDSYSASGSDDEDEDALTPLLLEGLCDEGVTKIAVGRTHCAAITDGGDVYTWGHNEYGQLALTATEQPKKLNSGLAQGDEIIYGCFPSSPMHCLSLSLSPSTKTCAIIELIRFHHPSEEEH
jgi:hypothetical protein